MIIKQTLADVGGRMILPSGIVFLTTALIPLVVFIAPTARHLWPTLFTAQYQWVWLFPIISGSLFLILVVGLEWKKK